jgi:signal transduction histidine kinase
MEDFFGSLKRRIARTSIIFRLLAFVVIPIVLVIGVTATYLLDALEKRFERRMEEDVEMVARSLQLPVSHALERKRLGSLGKSLQSAMRISRVYGVRLFDQNGELIASTVQGDRGSEDAPDSVVETSDPKERHREYGTVAGESAYTYFVPLFGSAEQTIGFMEVSRRKRDFDQLMSRLQWIGLGVALVVVVLVSLVALGGYHTAVGRALGRLRESMRTIEEGDHDHRASESGPRELASVARSLNNMVDSLQDAERRVQRQHRQKAHLKDELRESEKMAAVGRVSAGVAHELGNPLSTLAGHLQRLDRRTDEDDPDARAIEVMTRETDRMENIIQQMLDFGRTSGTEPSTVSPSQSVDLCRSRLVQLASEHGAALEFDAPDSPEDTELQVTTARLEQALSNLVANAGRASSEGRVRLTWRVTDDHVEYRVGDDGSGVDPEVRDELFEPFVTTEADEGGAGLGLAIVEAVAREHDGYASLDRSPLGGAQFRLGIPHTGDRA